MESCLIIFDIDETLYINHESRIPEGTLDAIHKLKTAGHMLAIATGRALFELIDEVKNLPFDFFILANGQLVLRHDEVIYENPIEQEILQEILADAKEAGVHIGFNSATHSSVTGLTDLMQVAFEKYYTNMPLVAPGIDEHGSIYQIWYLSEDIATVSEKFKDKLRFLPWLSGGADVIPAGSSKANGLMKTIEALDDVLPKKIVFFGDGINDIELIQMADIGIAMGNAVDALKEVADFVTKNIEDEGIYYACEQLGLFEDAVNDKDMNELIAKLTAQIENEPHSLENYLHLKTLYSSYRQDSIAAVNVLKQALIHLPDNVTLLLELATVHEFELEDIQSARKYYEQVLALEPTNELALSGLDILNDQNIHS